MSKERYSSFLGNTIIEQFENNEEIEEIVFVRFNIKKYAKWLKKEADTQNKRAEWAVFCTTKKETRKRNFKKSTKPCAVCKEDFEGIERSKFCSNKCRQRDKNLRKKEKQ